LKLPVRVPLIVFTPKSLLRHPLCVSPVEDFTEKIFRPLFDDPEIDPGRVKTVLLCSGKIYYELLQHRQSSRRDDVAILRLEQLYPLPFQTLRRVAGRFQAARRWIWVQEEPENMGAGTFVIRTADFLPLELLARKPSASPATGFSKFHQVEQQCIIENAFK